jgi:hypothetical protein
MLACANAIAGALAQIKAVAINSTNISTHMKPGKKC